MATLLSRREVGRVIDPVCGMAVEPNNAAAAWEHKGTTYYFCSLGCWKRFRDDPDAHLSMEPRNRRM